MPALLPELIALASDPTVKTSTLLRKALVAARQLKQTDQTAWIDLELRGYRQSDPLPLYRYIRAPVYLRQVETGRLSDLFTFQDNSEITAQAYLCRDSISKLEAQEVQGTLFVQLHSGHLVYSCLPVEGRNQYQVGHLLDASQCQYVVFQVHDKVLSWALELDAAGIERGDQSSPPQEPLLAPVTITIGGDFTGGQVMVNSPGGQQQTVTGARKAAALPGLVQGVAAAPLHQADRDVLRTELDTLKARAPSAKRKWTLLAVLAGSVGAILESAGGGVLTDLLLKWLATLSGH